MSKQVQKMYRMFVRDETEAIMNKSPFPDLTFAAEVVI